MLDIFLSLVFSLVFAFSALLCLNYMVYLWENKRIDDLVSKIRPGQNDNLNQANAKHGFTTIDLGPNLGTSFERSLVHLNQKQYPVWVENILKIIINFRRNFQLQIKNSLKFLISLTQPANTRTLQALKTAKEVKQEEEINEVVNSIQNLTKNSDFTNEESENTLNPIQSAVKQAVNSFSQTNLNSNIEDKTDLNSDNLKHPSKVSSNATLDMVTERKENLGNSNKNSTTKKSKSTSFEKLETRILAKLQELGLNHYDIWLELGELYRLHGQKDKAIEIYALVLKHSSGKEKEIARNNLIAIS